VIPPKKISIYMVQVTEAAQVLFLSRLLTPFQLFSSSIKSLVVERKSVHFEIEH
jgi:hypothetical protein